MLAGKWLLTQLWVKHQAHRLYAYHTFLHSIRESITIYIQTNIHHDFGQLNMWHLKHIRQHGQYTNTDTLCRFVWNRVFGAWSASLCFSRWFITIFIPFFIATEPWCVTMSILSTCIQLNLDSCSNRHFRNYSVFHSFFRSNMHMHISVI